MDVSADERTVLLRGLAPRRDDNCNVRGYFEDRLYFSLAAAVEAAPTDRTEGTVAELSPLDARERAIEILLGNPYGSTPKEVDGNIVSQEFGIDAKCGSNRRAWVFHVVVKPSQSIPDGIGGYLTIDAVTGKPICMGLPFLD